jgi:hypothetical protein
MVKRIPGESAEAGVAPKEQTASKDPEQPVVISNSLQEDYEECISQYVKKYGNAFLLNYPKDLREIYQRACSRTITLHPEMRSFSLKQGLSEATMKNIPLILSSLAGDDVKSCDIYQETDGTDTQNFYNLIPDIQILHEITSRPIQNGFLYMTIMSIPPSLRDLPALALSRRPEVAESCFKLTSETLERIRRYTLPTLTELVAVAKEYGITDIKPVLLSLNEAVGRYKVNWN